jgi:hypothetical protein
MLGLIKGAGALYAAAALATSLGATPAMAQGDLRPTAFNTPAEARGAFDAPVVWFDGRPYCWYERAWRGPGWYRCGFEWRAGYGWGGWYGWRGFYPGHHHWHGHVPRPPRPNHPRPPANPAPGHPGPGHPAPGHPGPGHPGHPGKPPGGPKPPAGGGHPRP